MALGPHPHSHWPSMSTVVAWAVISACRRNWVRGGWGVCICRCKHEGMVGVVKRAVGGGFDIKCRGGLRAGMPDAEFKGEDMEAATRKLESPPLLVSYQYTVKFDKKFKTIVILTI